MAQHKGHNHPELLAARAEGDMRRRLEGLLPDITGILPPVDPRQVEAHKRRLSAQILEVCQAYVHEDAVASKAQARPHWQAISETARRLAGLLQHPLSQQIVSPRDFAEVITVTVPVVDPETGKETGKKEGRVCGSALEELAKRADRAAAGLGKKGPGDRAVAIPHWSPLTHLALRCLDLFRAGARVKPTRDNDYYVLLGLVLEVAIGPHQHDLEAAARNALRFSKGAADAST